MIKEILNAFALATERTWSTDRSQTCGASEIGQCARKIAFEKTEGDAAVRASRDEDHAESWGATRRGTLIEDHFWFPAMKIRFGTDLLFAGPEQKTFQSGFLSATPDGLLINQPADALADLGVGDCGGQILLDCKSIDPRSRLDRAKDAHVFQVIVGMGVIRETTNYRPNFAVLSYIDASFFDRMTEFAVAFDPAVYAEAKSRARQIMTARRGADLKPEGIIAGGKECEFCAFARQCGVERATRVPDQAKDIDPVVAQRIRDRALLVKIKEADVKATTKDIGELKQSIRDDLEAVGSKSLPGVVSWAAVKGREGWDDSAIREAAVAAGIDLNPFKRQSDASDRLTITLK